MPELPTTSMQCQAAAAGRCTTVSNKITLYCHTRPRLQVSQLQSALSTGQYKHVNTA